MKTLGIAQSGEASGSGSSTVTSSAAARDPVACSVSISAASSATLPRATLTNTADGFMAAKAAALIRPVGLGRERAGQRHEVGLRHELHQVAHAVDRIGAVGALRGIAADADDLHVEGLGELGEMAADAAHADDQQGLAAQLVLALGEVADHAAPHLLVLVVARLGQPPRHAPGSARSRARPRRGR